MTRSYSASEVNRVAARSYDDFGRFAYDGFGIMLTDEQLAARAELGRPGPRQAGEAKFNWLSGGTRSGKTVLEWLLHAEACLYKNGLDQADDVYWRNYAYPTLALAPTDALALRLYAIADAMSKGTNEAQWDRKNRRGRPGAFLHLYNVGKDSKGNGLVTFTNGAFVDFRSSEGGAKRLEGGQWWFITWDEWASQPDYEIRSIRTSVLLARARDHDAKIMPAAWPKPETERHLIEVERAIETGSDRDSKIIYLSSEKAYFTDQRALAVEKRQMTKAEYRRGILGRPAGGAMVEFKSHMLDRMFRPGVPVQEPRLDGYRYLSATDLGVGKDDTAGITLRIPVVGGKPMVGPASDGEPWAKARIVHAWELPASEQLTLDRVGFEVIREQQAYNSLAAVDASSMGGLMAFRALREVMRPAPLAFISKSNDRIHGNIRLAAITNGLDLLTWGRSDEKSATYGEDGYEWGLVEASPELVKLRDQMANFDRDAKDSTTLKDDWVWALLIALWYVKRYFLVTSGVHVARPFDVRSRGRPARLIRGRVAAPVAEAVDQGIRYIQPRR